MGELDHFYFSKFADNTSESLKNFFAERFFTDGSLLFDEQSTAWLDFKAAAGDKLKNLTFRQTKTIIDTATSRTRNWAHIGTLDQGKFELARLVATIDARTSAFCLTIDGKLIRVGVAQTAIQRLNRLDPSEFAQELYESDLAKRLRKEPAANIRAFLEDDGKTISDTLVATGLGFPPFHPNCRTRVEGVIEGVGDDAKS